MRRILIIFISSLLLCSCQKSEDKAVETVKSFEALARQGLAKTDSIYPNFSLLPDVTRPTVAELTKIGDFENFKSKKISESQEADTCLVTCENVCYDNAGKLQRFRVKFTVSVSANGNRICSSVGLVQLTPEYRSMLEKTGAITDNSEDTFIAYSYNDFKDFVSSLYEQYGNHISEVQFKGDEYGAFLKYKCDYQNQHMFDRIKEYMSH